MKLTLSVGYDLKDQRFSKEENMARGMRIIAICVGFLILAPFNTATFGAHGPKAKHAHGPKAKNFRAGAVYVLTNQTNNTIAVFRRTAKGMLTFAAEFPTGGAGDPTPATSGSGD
jgi:hypothetical protein